jgi:hypothetical protein
MTQRQFYDWQTLGGAKDVSRLVAALEEREISWCMIGDLAVNHWSVESMTTADVDIVIAADQIDTAIVALKAAGFLSDQTQNPIYFKGESKINIQLRTEEIYHDCPARSVPASVHGILMRVASLQHTIDSKVGAFDEASEKPSHRQKRLLDISRLVEFHPELLQLLPSDIVAKLDS